MAKRDSIRVEFDVRLKKSPKVGITQKALREMVNLWVETGLEPSGVQIEAVSWSHDGGATERRAKRGTEEMEAARVNMLRRFLPGAQWGVIAKVGASGRARGS